jgi:hypothetical protein
MNAYNVRVTVAITEEETAEGVRLAPNTYLNYSTDFRIEGETLTDIAPQIDRLVAAMKAEGVTDGSL